jgi:hypothetical protein
MLHTSGLLFVLVFMLLVWWPVGWTSCFPLEWKLAYCRCVGASVLGRVCTCMRGYVSVALFSPGLVLVTRPPDGPQ